MVIKVNLSELSYELPERLIAQEPAPERDGARMLVIDRATGSWEDRYFRELPGYLRRGDCLVLNNSRVLPSRLFGRREGREARLQILLVKQLSADAREWTALVRPGRKVRTGDRILFDEGLAAQVTEWGERGQRTLRFDDERDILERIERIGHIPLPPYIHREDEARDRERYQTVFARERGSVAAPTAGLHFTEAVLERARAAGAEIAEVTLHVGLGTFRPIEAERVEDHRMHAETYSVAAEEWEKVEAAERVVAVGTTSVRTVESVARSGVLFGDTELFICERDSFRRTGAMLTNFHLPHTSLLVLVCAFAGKDLILEAYRHAVREEYRFFSYGDCMLII